MWMEVFKTGTHTSAEGKTKTYTEKDLDEMAKLYNEQKAHEAPLVIGHPATNDPAYGWTKELKREGQKLMAFVEAVSDKVKDAVRTGMFKKVSISIYGNGLLRHIGLLGAQPPAIKDLAPVKFNDGESFEGYEFSARNGFVERFMEFFAEIFGQEKADHVFPSKDGSHIIINHEEAKMTPEEIKKAIDEAVNAAKASFSEKLTEVQTELKAEKDGRAADQLKYAEDLKKQKLESSVVDFTLFCDGLIKDGKVLPAERDELIKEFRDTYLADTQMKFSEGEKTLVARFRERLEKRPVLVDPKKANFTRSENQEEVENQFAEFGDKLDASTIDIDETIKKIAKERNLSYEDAAIYYTTH